MPSTRERSHRARCAAASMPISAARTSGREASASSSRAASVPHGRRIDGLAETGRSGSPTFIEAQIAASVNRVRFAIVLHRATHDLDSGRIAPGRPRLEFADVASSKAGLGDAREPLHQVGVLDGQL